MIKKKTSNSFIPGERLRKRTLMVFLLTLILVSPLISGLTWIYATTLTETIVEEGSMTSECTYLGFRVGSSYYYRNGKTGDVSGSYANPTTMFEYVTNTLMTSGGTFFLEANDYDLTSTWDILQNDITITGEGYATHISTTGVGNSYSAICIGDGTTVRTNIAITNLRLDGDRTDKTGDHADGSHFNGLISVKWATYFTLDSCWLEHHRGNGISFAPRATDRHEYGRVVNNFFSDTLSALGAGGQCDAGVSMAGMDYGVVCQNTFTDCDNGGIWIGDNRWTVASDNNVQSPTFGRNGIGLSHGGAPQLYAGSKFCTVSNNVINCTEKGIYLYGTATSQNTVTGNTIVSLFTAGEKAGILFWTGEAGYNNTCIGNVIFGVNTAGSVGIDEEAGWDGNIIVGNIINQVPTGVSISGANTINQHNIEG